MFGQKTKQKNTFDVDGVTARQLDNEQIWFDENMALLQNAHKTASATFRAVFNLKTQLTIRETSAIQNNKKARLEAEIKKRDSSNMPHVVGIVGAYVVGVSCLKAAFPAMPIPEVALAFVAAGAMLGYKYNNEKKIDAVTTHPAVKTAFNGFAKRLQEFGDKHEATYSAEILAAKADLIAAEPKLAPELERVAAIQTEKEKNQQNLYQGISNPLHINGRKLILQPRRA